jgi:hypothetical protein
MIDDWWRKREGLASQSFPFSTEPRLVKHDSFNEDSPCSIGGTMPVQLRHGQRLISPRWRLILPRPGVVPRSIFLRSIVNCVRRPTFQARAGAPWIVHHSSRGAKTKSTTKLKDLPQGALKLEAYNDGADDTPRYPTVVQGHRNNMEKFKNCVILTRVGGFYEVRLRLANNTQTRHADRRSSTLNKQKNWLPC